MHFFIVNAKINVIIFHKMTHNLTIGKRIQQKRKSSGLSQQALANKLKVSRSLIGQIETDKSKPSLEHLSQIIHILDTDYQYLIEGDPSIQETTGWRLEEEGPIYSSATEGTEQKNLPSFDRNDPADMRIHLYYQAEIIERVKAENKALREGMAALNELLQHYQKNINPDKTGNSHSL